MPEIWEYYRDECIKVGKPDPGPHDGGDTSFFHLSHDPDKAWDAIAPFAMHELNSAEPMDFQQHAGYRERLRFQVLHCDEARPME